MIEKLVAVVVREVVARPVVMFLELGERYVAAREQQLARMNETAEEMHARHRRECEEWRRRQTR